MSNDDAKPKETAHSSGAFHGSQHGGGDAGDFGRSQPATARPPSSIRVATIAGEYSKQVIVLELPTVRSHDEVIKWLTDVRDEVAAEYAVRETQPCPSDGVETPAHAIEVGKEYLFLDQPVTVIEIYGDVEASVKTRLEEYTIVKLGELKEWARDTPGASSAGKK